MSSSLPSQGPPGSPEPTATPPAPQGARAVPALPAAARPLRERLAFYTRVQWALATGMVVGVAAFYLLGYRPAMHRQETLRIQILSKQREVDQNHDKTRTLPILAKEVQQLEEQVQLYGRQLPRDPELSQFLGDVTQISRRLDLREWKYQPSAPKAGDSYYELPIQMHFEGDFVNAASFLRQTEELQRLTRVKKLTVKGTDRKRGTVEVDVAMNIYFSEGR